MEPHSRFFGDDVRRRGLARAGRAVKNHVGDVSLLCHAAKRAVFAEQMLLSDHFVKGHRAHSIGRRTFFIILIIQFI